MKKSVLVTGCLGFVGFHLTKTLLQEGYEVSGVDWSRTAGDKQFYITKHGGKVFNQGFSDYEILDAVSRGVYNTVFHLAAIPRVSYSVEYPHETHQDNVANTVELLEAFRQSKFPGQLNPGRFIFSSSSSVYGGANMLPTPETHPKNPKSPYALHKSVIEDYCRVYSETYGLDTVCLRYFNVVGPGADGKGAYATAVSSWLHAIKNQLPLRSDGDGTQSRDLCPVENVVHANILAMEHPTKLSGDCFNVACGSRTTNKEILDYLLKLFPGIKLQQAPWRAGDVMHTQADISKIENVLGYKPKLQFWESLENTIKSELGVK